LWGAFFLRDWWSVISDAALDRIISAVGITLEKSTREELRREIKNAAAWYRDAVIINDKGRATTLEERLDAFRKAAKSLHAQLADQSFYELIEGTLIIHGLDRWPTNIRAIMKQLIRAADLVRKPPSGAISAHAPAGLLEVPALEWLAGWQLPDIYERIFDRRSGRSRTKAGDPVGPCVRFIETAMAQLRIKYSRESIVRAITARRAAPGRGVRRGRKK
jgi:hypothetical protein